MMDFYNWISSSLNDIHAFFTDGVPYIISRSLAYVVEIGLYLKIQSEIMMIKIGFSVAQQIMTDINISAVLQPLLNSLPSGLKWFASASGIIDGINIVLHALAARFALNFLGW